MNNQVLNDIVKFATKRLTDEYGYCGVANGPTTTLLNSGGESETIVISIKETSY